MSAFWIFAVALTVAYIIYYCVIIATIRRTNMRFILKGIKLINISFAFAPPETPSVPNCIIY